MKDNLLTKISIIVMPTCWVIGIIVALVMYFGFDNKPYALSYVLGLVTALMNLGLHMSNGKGFMNEVNKADGAPVRRSILGYALRILIAGVVFAFIVHEQYTRETPRFYVIPALIGYLTERVIFIIVSLVLNLRSKGKVNA